jgi:hypothetical protein
MYYRHTEPYSSVPSVLSKVKSTPLNIQNLRVTEKSQKNTPLKVVRVEFLVYKTTFTHTHIYIPNFDRL